VVELAEGAVEQVAQGCAKRIEKARVVLAQEGVHRPVRPRGQHAPGRAADLALLTPERTGQDGVARKVGADGVVCVSWQQVSVGKHHAGARCDVPVGKDLLQFWVGSDLLKTTTRTSSGEVRKKRGTSLICNPECQRSTG
jgi:hypothetical protein